MALPTRARPSFSHTKPSNQEAYTSLLESSIRGWTEEARRTIIPQWLEPKLNYRKLIRMKKQKLYPRWRDKIKPQKTTNWRRKTIQNNNSEGFRILETEWRRSRNVSQRPRRTKEQQTEANNALEGINVRITETEEPISELEDRMVEISTTNRI